MIKILSTLFLIVSSLATANETSVEDRGVCELVEHETSKPFLFHTTTSRNRHKVENITINECLDLARSLLVKKWDEVIEVCGSHGVDCDEITYHFRIKRVNYRMRVGNEILKGSITKSK